MDDRSDKPELAVVVISLGAPPELTAAVQSILDQDTPAELIVVNSGGGDVASRLPAGAANVKIVSTVETWWPGAARNRGIEATEAPFIAFLAADCTAEPGWVAARLHHHRRGAAVVASAIVNGNPRSLVSVAYHLVHAANRDVNIPVHRASGFGASYARWIFQRYGLFREDLRVAEDSEFHHRFNPREQPRWAPDVRTVHQNPTRLLPALRQHFARGRLYGLHWPERYGDGRFVVRVRRILDMRIADLRALSPKPVPGGVLAAQAVMAAMIVANQLGKSQGHKRSSAAIRAELTARDAERRRDWPRALSFWAKTAKLSPAPLWPRRNRAETLARTRRYAEARAEYAGLAERYPDDCSLQLAEALMALAAGDPGLAQSLATKAAARFGRVLPIVECLALTQQALGDLDASSATYAELSASYPYSPIGWWGQAEIALARQDWTLSLVLLDDLWSLFGDSIALQRKARLLLYLGRPVELEATLSLPAGDPAGRAGYLLTMLHVLAARSDGSGLLDLLASHEREIAADSTLLGAFANALSVAGHTERARALVALSPPEIVAARPLVDVLALLYAGRYAEAWKGYQAIDNSRKVSEMTTSAVSALAAAAYDSDGPEAAAAFVEHLGGKKSRATLRIAAVFQSARLASLAALSETPPRIDDVTLPSELAVAPLLAGRLKTPQGERELGLLEQCRQTFVALRARHEDFALDPSFVFADALKVAARIARAARLGQPLSMVRLGDGEGNLLPYRDRYSAFRPTDIAATGRIWWGEDAPGIGDDLERQLRHAVDRADIVGFPDLLRVSHTVAPAALLSPDSRGRNARGLLAALDFIATPRQQLLTSCHIHQSLAYWGLWDVLLPQLGSVSVITCHEQLGPALTRRFGLQIAATHLVPPEGKHAAKFTSQIAGRHYPDRFEQLRPELAATPPEHIVLVAAGMLGKIYCDWIKAAGGIALDVGSAADIWCGYHTRAPDENASYVSPVGIRERLEALATHDPRMASVMGVAAGRQDVLGN